MSSRRGFGVVIGACYAQNGDAAGVRHDLVQHLEALAEDVRGEDGQTGQVAAGSSQALREAESHRIVDDRHDDRDRARRLFYGAGRRFAAGDNHIWFQRGELGRERREPPIVALRRAHLQAIFWPST